MPNLAAHSELVDRSRDMNLDSYVSWQHPLNSGRIYMPPEVVRTVSTRALEALKANPSSEIGGLLWGEPYLKSDSPSTLILYPEFIASQAETYNTSAADCFSLNRATEEGKTKHPQALLGYFRSHIRDGLSLSAEDQKYIETYHRNQSAVFLVVRPFEMGICIAGFFFWDGNRLQTDGSELEVPFSPGSKLITAESPERVATRSSRPLTSQVNPSTTEFGTEIPKPRNAPERADAGAISAATSAKEVTAETSPRQKPRRPKFLLRFAISGGFIAMVGAAGYWMIPTLRSRVEGLRAYTGNSQLGLQVIRAADGQLSLSWNRTASELTLADSGTLAVIDGSLKRELSMDKAQLRSGKLTYFPTGADVQFRLELALQDGRSVAESVRVLLPQTQVQSQSRIQTPSAPPETRVAARPAPKTRIDDARKRTNVPRPDPERPETTTTFRSIRLDDLSFKPQQPLAAKPDAVLPPPIVTYDPVRENTARLDLLLTLLPQPPRWPTFESNTDPRPQTMGSPSAPVSSAAPTARFVPPQPLKQVSPNLKQLVTPINSATEVRVRVQVSQTGRVVDAFVEGNEKNGNSLLNQVVLAAARQWLFDPATLRGKAVTASHTIIFEFRPAAR